MAKSRVEMALESIGLRNEYLQEFDGNSFDPFTDNELDDETVDYCFSDKDLTENLHRIIPKLGHYIKFQKAFKELSAAGPSSIPNPSKEEDVVLNLGISVEDMKVLMPQDSCAIGIDLGTTYSCVAVCIHGEIEVIPWNGIITIPSYVAFNDNNSVSVGETAKDQALHRPESTIFDAKRLIGRNFSDESVQKYMKLWPFQVIGENDQPKIKIPGHQKTYRPEDISAKILSHLKKTAEEYLKKPVTHAIVTVPAYFSDNQRQATKDAAKIAGLNVKLLNEPNAAAIAYDLHRRADLNRNVLIFDLGGGSFDVAVLQMKGGEIYVKAINGDAHLSGDDFDNEMVKHIIAVVKRKTGRDLGHGRNSSHTAEKSSAERRIKRIRAICEKQKCYLSDSKSAKIIIDSIDENYDLNEPISRKEFEDLNMTMFQRCMDITTVVIREANMNNADIDDIVLVGGSTRIPKIRELIMQNFIGKALHATIDSEEIVAIGAAIQAALEFGN